MRLGEFGAIGDTDEGAELLRCCFTDTEGKPGVM